MDFPTSIFNNFDLSSFAVRVIPLVNRALLKDKKIVVVSNNNFFRFKELFSFLEGAKNEEQVIQYYEGGNTLNSEQYNLFIIDWDYLIQHISQEDHKAEKLEKITRLSRGSEPVFIYAPANNIPAGILSGLLNKDNIVIVQARSRLLSDILTYLIFNNRTPEERMHSEDTTPF